jgi:hypothetical protein
MIREKIRKNLDKIIKIASLLCLIALLFAAFFSINYARKRSESVILSGTIFREKYRYTMRNMCRTVNRLRLITG